MTQAHWELIKLRKTHNISQEKMAKILDINASTYSKKENGKNDFKSNEMFIVARLFNKRLDEIFLPRNISNPDKNVKEGVSCGTTD